MYLLLWLCVGGLTWHGLPMLPPTWRIGNAIEGSRALKVVAFLVIAGYLTVYVALTGAVSIWRRQ